MRIAVVGTGYVGLVVGAGLSDFGNDVICVGDDSEQLSRLSRGEVRLHEPGLAPLLASNIEAGRLRFSSDLRAAVKEAEVIILASRVHTDAQGSAQLDDLFKAADVIADSLDGYKVVAVKSAVPVGTTDRLLVRIGARAKCPFGVAYNPAFMREANAVEDFMAPDRVVFGTHDPRAAEVLRRLYAPMVRTTDRIFAVDPRSAELSKIATSGLLAARISYMNELAMLAGELGADIEVVRCIMGADHRIGPKSLFVGPGFGGARFKDDMAMLLHSAGEVGSELAVVRASRLVNERQKQVPFAKLRRFLPGDLEDKTVAIWGLAFKPGSDHIGHAPAVALIDSLLKAGVNVRAHDPVAMDNARAHYGERVTFCDTMYDAVKGADALVMVTEWRQYRRPDFQRVAGLMQGTLLIDGRNVWEPAELAELGFRYSGIGRGAGTPRASLVPGGLGKREN